MCLHFARKLLSGRSRWPVNAFLDAWQSSVPEVCSYHEPKQVHNSNGGHDLQRNLLKGEALPQGPPFSTCKETIVMARRVGRHGACFRA